MSRATTQSTLPIAFEVETGSGPIEGTLDLPEAAAGVAVFAHGSGSSRHSPRNRFVAEALQRRRLGTLLIDLLTQREEKVDAVTAQHRFDIGLLTERLLLAAGWLTKNEATRDLPTGFFGASTGGAAALAAAARLPKTAAVVSRGGRPDLAGDALRSVQAPTLLIVGERDYPVIGLNQAAYRLLEKSREKEVAIVPGATHLFEESGALEEVAQLAGDWFVRHFQARQDRPSPR
jgi:pimeloyl-ACP methyl ester carboxylesterase